MTGEGLAEQTVGTHRNYLYGKLSVFWNEKMTGEWLVEQTVDTDGNHF
jgi:hypothetical protein